ncbi:hypothetical protein GH714_007584 [Hevea brasiliensis]|uniref:Uncharacterized protein n=1 Tax=Hevea brasiliensis TaxID=3981 RepID=A0A6A6MCS2_HEVBR|nr:hypothetical protein GH714_007584 [Hevea brasiliensis]
MAAENFVQPAIPRFDGHYDHWSMLMENFLRSKEYWTVVESGLADPAADVVLSDAQKAEHEALKLKDLKAKNYLFQAIDRYGHYQSECRTNLNRDGGRQSNFVEKEEDSEITLLMAYQALNQIEEDTKQNIWYLDTAASNHMSGNKSVFSFLDESYQDSVKFGNNSRVSIMGKGQVTIQTTRNVTHKISDVFYVPDLKTNLLSVGQLQEKGYEIQIKDGIFRLLDDNLGLIAQVKMTTNRMFPLHLNHVDNSCFLVKEGDEAWLWHFRYGHLNFGGLKTLQQKKMVIGLPQITPPSQICEDCVVSKQHRNSFPQGKSKRAKAALELVHSDICGPITPCSNGVKIPTNFDGENEEEVPTAVSGNSQNDVDDVPNSNLAPIMEAETETPTNSRAQRIRKRPAWMSDYEVTGIDISEDPLTYLALFSDCDPTNFETDGLKYYDVVKGKGPIAEKGLTVQVHFDCLYRVITAVSSRESKLLAGNRIIAQVIISFSQQNLSIFVCALIPADKDLPNQTS